MKPAPPAGSWPSPLSAAQVAAGSTRIGDVLCDGERVLWVERRPLEGGRSALVEAVPGAPPRDRIEAPWSVLTRVHEYGGGAFTAHAGSVWFSNATDQRVWRSDPGGSPRPVTPDDGRRYADAVVDAWRSRLLAVCEDARGEGEPQNLLVTLPLDGAGAPQPLVEGHDFFSTPRLSPDGERLCWLAWDHPDMPWDASRLFVASVSADGSLGDVRCVAGGPGVSVFQPGWTAGGRLVYVSDESGWWNLYEAGDAGPRALCPREAEFGLPHWVFRMSTWAELGDGRLACAVCETGSWRLGLLDPETSGLEFVDLPYSALASLCAVPGGVVFSAAGPDAGERLVRLDPSTGRQDVLNEAVPDPLPAAFVSVPRSIACPVGDETCHAFFYPPVHAEHRLAEGERPPLLVKSHGGPTAASAPVFDPRIQFWTTRGFAVLDVNYRGSTGYGRAYREGLEGQWGVVDREDCEAAARHLVESGEADPERLAITGGSAGGYTTLCALTFGDLFRAGASHYGVSDLESLARDTHKFEARYLDRLVGPWPGRRDLYEARSPLHHADRLSCPVIFFQGSEDRVVPPAQAEQMVEALRAKGLTVEYHVFDGEAHGFRRAENVEAALEAELAFYLRVFAT